MRRSIVIAVVLALALAGVAQAGPPVARVTGGATYFVAGDPAQPRTIMVGAQAGDGVRGSWTWIRPSGVYGGPVTCLQTLETPDGNVAWFAGPATRVGGSEDVFAVFFLFLDGGTPGRDGDYVFGWAADPGETLADMEALCESMDTYLYGDSPFQVVSGNLSVFARG
jgi:hypothetical protein